MKAGSRPQYYRIRRMVQMVREGSETGYLPNSRDFMGEFGVSRRTVARDLDFLREEERTPLEYDEARHGFRLTGDKLRRLPWVTRWFSCIECNKLAAHPSIPPGSQRSFCFGPTVKTPELSHITGIAEVEKHPRNQGRYKKGRVLPSGPGWVLPVRTLALSGSWHCPLRWAL